MNQTEDKEKDEEELIGAMKKRRVKMADGKRYLIYYTFENSEKPAVFEPGKTKEEHENV